MCIKLPARLNMEDESFLCRVLGYHREEKWKEILQMSENGTRKAALDLLWVWPSVGNLDFICAKLGEFGVDGVTSLGCGCGLFEWILQKYTNMPVIGYEVNREWWTSKYSNPLFIPHVYPDLPPRKDSFKRNHALLFCYFNDGAAFIDYVDAYDGPVIFIIGPGEGRGTHTEPEPFKPKFGNTGWILDSFQEVKSSKDFIAVYKRS